MYLMAQMFPGQHPGGEMILELCQVAVLPSCRAMAAVLTCTGNSGRLWDPCQKQADHWSLGSDATISSCCILAGAVVIYL